MALIQLRNTINGKTTLVHHTAVERETAGGSWTVDADAATEGSLPAISKTIADVLDWVGGDPERAMAALNAEADAHRAKPRKSLISALETLISNTAADSTENQ